ncbi:hypothetical protein F5X98DRAFT_370787 [Xylaria grammica]|nr:hypothetical protein F5X98DRAFT_370787 [Xylaria grammica]
MSIIIPVEDGVEVLDAEALANGDDMALKVDTTETNGVTGTSTPGFKLEEHTIDDVRPLRVAVVGAGIGGINPGILFPAKMPRIRNGTVTQQSGQSNCTPEYEGHLQHTWNWDPNFDSKSKTIAVIGNGASGIQLVPNLQRIAPNDVRTLEPQYFSAEHLKELEDPDAYLEYWKREEDKNWRGVGGIIPGAKENEEVGNLSLKILKQRLVDKPELLDKSVPNFSPHCRRLASGPGYLEALDVDNINYIQFHICHSSHCWLNPFRDNIKRFTFEAMDGIHRQVDAIFCVTGFNNKLTPPFLIVANGADLGPAWSPGGKWGIASTCFGLATPGFPNLLWHGKAHSGAATGTFNYSCETGITYHTQLLRKASSQGTKTI